MALCIVLISLSLFAGVPKIIPVQGVLTDRDGAPLNGEQQVTFTLFDAESDGTKIWEEVQDELDVEDGFFAASLGEQASLDISEIYQKDELWLEITVNNDKMDRISMGSALYAVRSDLAESAKNADNADTVGGKTVAQIIESAKSTSSTGVSPQVQALIDDLKAEITSLKTTVSAQANAVLSNSSKTGITSSQVSAISANSAKTGITSSQASAITSNSAKTKAMSVNNNTVRFTGVNVQVVNGTGSESSINGLGNLIVGYNSKRSSGSNRTGSHNLVVGNKHNYSSYGGLVAGYHNAVTTYYSSVTGGYSGSVSGSYDWKAGTLFEDN